MNGKDTASPASSPSSGVDSGVDTVTRQRQRGALVSYANEPEGQHMATALVRELQARGCDVISDHDLPRQNPVSVATWMDDQIAARTVLCVITAGYVHAYQETEAAPKRKGVRYELRAIRQRIYDHEGRYGCPVIPVTTTTFPLDLVPETLRGLNISRFDPDTGAGADELAERIAALEGKRGDPYRFRQVLRELEDDRPAVQAIELVGEALRLAEDPDLSWDLVHAFPRLADVLKDHGQVSLMRTLTDRCLDALREKTPLLQWELEIKARLLICGKAWYLQRDRLLREALDDAREGIRLAERFDVRRTAAYGRQCVGRIQRLLAEDGNDVEHHLRVSAQTISEAVALFRAIDGDHPRRSEAGACLTLGARTQLTRYRLLGDTGALADAEAMATEAAGMLTAEQQKDRHDLAILLGEIAAANRRHTEGRKLLGGVIESLIAECGARSEILARAYVARAHIAPRSAKAEIVADLNKAREIFQRQQLTHAAAACEWDILSTDPRAVQISRADVLALERLTPDPRVRLGAVAKRAGQPDFHLARRQVDWAALVDRGR
jgi:hypothetical protein